MDNMRMSLEAIINDLDYLMQYDDYGTKHKEAIEKAKTACKNWRAIEDEMKYLDCEVWLKRQVLQIVRKFVEQIEGEENPRCQNCIRYTICTERNGCAGYEAWY